MVLTEIKTYDTETFRKKHLKEGSALNELFDKSLKDFFCLRLEDIVPETKLPILPSRETSHNIILITEGSYTTKIGFKEYIIRKNTLAIIQAGAIFSVDDLSNRMKGFGCHFHPNTLIGKFGNLSLISAFEFLNIGYDPLISLQEAACNAIINILTRLHNEFKRGEKMNADIVHSYLYALLTEIKICHPQSPVKPQNASLKLTAEFYNLVHQKARSNLKVTDFANLLNVSPNHLNKCVKSVTAKNATTLIDEVKLIEIKYLLYQSHLTIRQIAFEMGFDDPSYFSRFFKKYERVSPKAFRKMID